MNRRSGSESRPATARRVRTRSPRRGDPWPAFVYLGVPHTSSVYSKSLPYVSSSWQSAMHAIRRVTARDGLDAMPESVDGEAAIPPRTICACLREGPRCYEVSEGSLRCEARASRTVVADSFTVLPAICHETGSGASRAQQFAFWRSGGLIAPALPAECRESRAGATSPPNSHRDATAKMLSRADVSLIGLPRFPAFRGGAGCVVYAAQVVWPPLCDASVRRRGDRRSCPATGR